MPFEDDLRNFINLTHAYAWRQAKTVGKVPDEPGLVSAFIAKPMLDELERLVKAELGASTTVLVDGIFTHKTPTVRPMVAPNSNSVEIADLMLVRQHVNPNTGVPISGRAFLLQAKRNTVPNSGNVAAGNPLIQFNLYQNWPPFEGTTRLSQGAANSANWRFPNIPGNPYGRYLAVLDGNAFVPAVAPPVWQGCPARNAQFAPYTFPAEGSWGYGEIGPLTTPAAGVNCGTDFALLLAKFIKGNAGVPFTPGLWSQTDHWSTFVTEMLDHALSTNYTYLSARTGITQPTKRMGGISSFVAAQPILELLRRRYSVGFNKVLARRFWDIDKFDGWLPWIYWPWPDGKFFVSYRDIIRAIAREDDGDVLPPKVGNEQPPDEPGFPSLLSIVTIGDETPEGLKG
ncbi:hypothetical protein MIZ01_1135 [Sideroxyarcus emersonii]|uniref:Uncharacterized protein n=1 Tax=Sideroxyarcus emersonii TaxID=2764705 RepID=A0AAN1X9E5_9PROT|nr:hypothetical protein [Sideroxyarcus emersonii]BCK87357.1 hypothetical protein MIZ01_1135 [Sideroxyarcus emersonii]